MKKLGIEGDILTWIESFLSNRRQRVRINNSYSDYADILSGVPQGSVLGPILFILYINDLPMHANSRSNIFADDTKIFHQVESENDADMLQSDLNNLADWYNAWKMSFNTNKCHVIHYGKRNKKFLYHINGRLLEGVDTEKDLGCISHIL